MSLRRKTPLRSKRPKKDKPTMGQLINSGVVKKASSLGKRKADGQKVVFEFIWEDRPHKCQVCGVAIHEARAANFAHILPKGSYPELKLDPRNIWLMCCSQGEYVGCHDRQHFYGPSLRDSPKWSSFWSNYDKLREECDSKLFVKKDRKPKATESE